MTDKWDSTDGQTQFLDENGKLVDDISSWDDSQKLDYIRENLMDHLEGLEVDLLSAAQRRIEAQKSGGHSCYGAGYEDGMIDELVERKFICGYLLAACGNNNQQLKQVEVEGKINV